MDRFTVTAPAATLSNAAEPAAAASMPWGHPGAEGTAAPEMGSPASASGMQEGSCETGLGRKQQEQRDLQASS